MITQYYFVWGHKFIWCDAMLFCIGKQNRCLKKITQHHWFTCRYWTIELIVIEISWTTYHLVFYFPYFWSYWDCKRILIIFSCKFKREVTLDIFFQFFNQRSTAVFANVSLMGFVVISVIWKCFPVHLPCFKKCKMEYK